MSDPLCPDCGSDDVSEFRAHHLRASARPPFHCHACGIWTDSPDWRPAEVA